MASGERSWVLVLAAVVLGWGVVAPLVNHAILRWVGWRVAVPLVLGRVPARRELGRWRARCGECGRPLGSERLPMLAWTASAGRCRWCGAPRRSWTGAVEAATGVGFGVAAATWGWSWALPPVLVLVAGAVAMSAVDLWVMRIPTRFAWTTGAAVSATLLVAIALGGDVPARSIAGAAVGAAAFGGLLGVLYLVSPRLLGFGDVRLGVVSGAVLGWVGWSADDPVLGPMQLVFAALFVGSLVGTLWGAALLVVRRRNAPFPFGPALAVGAVAMALGAGLAS
ncbi:MAG TPA: A24 family peptidase [Acidimicrobiales bacterium]